MNVLFLSELFYPHGGGGELATYLYAKLLSNIDISVKVVTHRFLEEPRKSQDDNFEIYRLPLFKKTVGVKYSVLGRLDVLFSGFMRRLMSWADIVYIPRFWYSAIPLAKACGKVVVIHLHGYVPVCPIAVLYNLSKRTICHHRNKRICSPKCIMAYEKSNGKNSKEALTSVALNLTVGHYMGKLAALSDCIICVSEAQSRLIMKHTPSIESKLHVVYNPLPAVSEFKGEGSDFGYFGGSNILKGFDIICRALREVKPKINVHATKLLNLSINLSNSLRVLGITPYQKLNQKLYEELYKRIQVVIVPSVWPEPLPYVVSEALLSKRLIVASRVGGIPEQVKGAEGAFLFQPGNYEQLVEIIDFIKSLKREVVIDLGVQNKEAFLKKFNNRKILKNFADVLTKASGGKCHN